MPASCSAHYRRPPEASGQLLTGWHFATGAAPRRGLRALFAGLRRRSRHWLVATRAAPRRGLRARTPVLALLVLLLGCNRGSPPKRAAGPQGRQRHGRLRLPGQQEQPPEEGCGPASGRLSHRTRRYVQQEQPPEEGCGPHLVEHIDPKGFLITHEPQPVSASDKAWVGFGGLPM